MTIPSAEFEEGDVFITVFQDGVADHAGNTAPAADQTFQFNYDITKPSLTITAPDAIADPPNPPRTNGGEGDSVLIIFTWDDDLLTNSFDNTDIGLDPADGVTIRDASFTEETSAIYNVTLDLTDEAAEGDGRVTVTVQQNVVKDNATNPGPALDEEFVFIYDITGPELDPDEPITVTTQDTDVDIPDDGTYNGGEDVLVKFNWIEGTTFQITDITLERPSEDNKEITLDASWLGLQQADFSYTLEIPNGTLEENQGVIRIKINSDDVTDYVGNRGPVTAEVYEFTYDNNPPGAVEVESITSPTNEDYPLIKVTAYDTISSGDNQVKVRAFIGEDTSPSNQIYLSEVSIPLAPFRQVLIDGDRDENTSLHIIYNVDEDDNPIQLTDGNLLDGLLYENLILVFEDDAGNESILNVPDMTITPFRIDRTAPNPYGTGLDDYDGISYSPVSYTHLTLPTNREV